eukprot:403336557
MTVHLVMQYIEGINLLDFLLKNKKLSELKSSQILCGILQSLKNVHQSGIIHRDIKLANILVEESNLSKVYLLDFGISIFAKDKPSTFKKCGSPGYCDPQILDGSPFRYKSDIFSLGCIFYNLITGKHLFPGDSYKEIIFNNQFMDAQRTAERYLRQEISENGKILLLSMLARDYEFRPSAEQCLKLPYFRKLIIQNNQPHIYDKNITMLRNSISPSLFRIKDQECFEQNGEKYLPKKHLALSL